jgi:hypothetical protein
VRLECALLCDAVTVRESLLHILGGGVSYVTFPRYPAPVNLDVAVRVVFEPEDLSERRDHRLEGRLSAERGQLAHQTFDFATDPGDMEAALALPLSVGVMLPAAGHYRFELILDGEPLASLPLEARLGMPR